MSIQTFDAQQVKTIWAQAKAELKLQLSPAAFNTWILSNPLTDITETNLHELVCIISTPSAFHATNLKKNLYTQIKTAIENAAQKKISLDFKIREPAEIIAFQKQMSAKQDSRERKKNSFHNSEQLSTNQQLANNFHHSDSAQEVGSTRVEDLFSEQNIESTHQNRVLTASRRAGLRADYTFKTFAVSGSNEMAHAAATAVAKRPGDAYNPLFLYGGVGVGKTHLMQAIGNYVLEQDPQIKVIYCTGEEFTNEIIDAIRSKKAISFKKKFRSAQLLLIDDIQFIAGKNAVQEEFFHTFNSLTKLSSQIILTSDRPPSAINLMEDRLRSRFEAGLMVDIQQPSLELKTAIVLIKSRAIGLSLPIKIAEKIAQSVDGARKIEGTISIIRSEVELKNREINDELINDILAKENYSTRQNKIKLKPQKVLKKICDHFEIKQNDLKGSARNKEIVYPRHLAMYLLKENLDLSYVEIGKWFSNRDHTSVMHAKNKIEELLENDEEVIQDYNDLKAELIKISL